MVCLVLLPGHYTQTLIEPSATVSKYRTYEESACIVDTPRI